MAPPRAAFSRDQIVIAVTLVQMRCFGQPQTCPWENILAFTDEPSRRGRILLQHDACESILSGAMIPELVHQILATVIVMKQRRIEATAVEIHRIGPVAIDRGTRDEIVVEVAQRCARCTAHRRASVALHVGIDQVEQTVVVRQTRRPDAAGIGIAEHVELARPPQRTRQQTPVHQIARVKNLHARIPLERRGRDVVVIADPHDGGVGIEALENRIVNELRHGITERLPGPEQD